MVFCFFFLGGGGGCRSSSSHFSVRLAHRHPEPAKLGEEVPVVQQRQAVAGGHRRDVHAGQGAVPEPAARGLGKTYGGVQHRAQQREDRYVAGVLRPVVEWFVSYNHLKVVGLI